MTTLIFLETLTIIESFYQIIRLIHLKTLCTEHIYFLANKNHPENFLNHRNTEQKQTYSFHNY